MAEIPRGFSPWWQQIVSRPLRASAQVQAIDVETLIIEALRYSPRIHAISEHPLIRQTSIVEAEAEFDVKAFMESRFVRTSVPVGDALTTGGPPRLREEDWTHTAGFQKKTRWGGSLELSQRIGLRDSNSDFFVPDNQGNARLSLSFTQPLLNGAGCAYNSTLSVLAKIDTRVAWDRTFRELQDHLLLIVIAHWDLYLQRAALTQKKKRYDQAKIIRNELEARIKIDSLQSDVLRARAAVAMRGVELVRTEAAIRNTEATLRALVNSPEFHRTADVELVPASEPLQDHISIRLEDALVTALQHRPDIDESLQYIKAASIRLSASENELLPVLDLLLESYLSGLQGERQIGRSFDQQFNDGEPSFTVGLRFEMPLHNRAAKARYVRRQIELRQLKETFRAAVELVKTEVEVAVREVETAYREMAGRYRAMEAARADESYLAHRWRTLPGEDGISSVLLNDLLDAQDRLTNEEFTFVQSQVAYTTSFFELKRAMGTLLQCNGVMVRKTIDHGLPRISFEK